MNDKKRELKNRVAKRDLIIAIVVVSFILITAVLSYYYRDYGILKFISGGEKLFRFWIIVGLIILGIAGVIRIKKGGRRKP